MMSPPIARERLLDPLSATIDGLTIRYAAHDQKAPDTLLLLSPWPESIYAFAPMWPGLARQFNLLAVDLPGFGQSEGRADLMSPRAMGEFVVKAAAFFGIERLHAVGPDIGTSAVLFAAQAHPELFASIVAGAGASVFPLMIDGILKTLVEAKELPRVNPVDVVTQFVDSIQSYAVPDYVRADYLASYAGERFGRSVELVRNYPADLAALAPLLSSIDTPVRIIVGRDDPYGLVNDAKQLKTQLRHCRVDILECGHCAWEEQAVAYERLITTWVNGGFKDA
jgi:pimeloyl-ACP methyl ester carboxylesterase